MGSAPFYFRDNDPHESSMTWQVLRSEFDRLMLDNARERGVDVVEGAQVREVLFEELQAVGVAASMPDGDATDVSRARHRRCNRTKRAHLAAVENQPGRADAEEGLRVHAL